MPELFHNRESRPLPFPNPDPGFITSGQQTGFLFLMSLFHNYPLLAANSY